jgi:hypothetical protein
MRGGKQMWKDCHKISPNFRPSATYVRWIGIFDFWITHAQYLEIGITNAATTVRCAYQSTVRI